MLVACLVAWRRAVLEAQHLDGAADAEVLDEARVALSGYAGAAGVTDGFTLHVLEFPVGELDEPLFLEALYRLETAGAIAWTLRLMDELPPIDEGAGYEFLSSLFPLDGKPASTIGTATLRDPAELQAARTEWEAKLATARQARDASPDEDTSLRFSRAFERVRGIAWVSSNAPTLEDVEV